MSAQWDNITYFTNDNAFIYSINQGMSEPYYGGDNSQLNTVKRYLNIHPTKNRVMLDIGAHIGTTMIPYSRFFSKVYGFEPNLESYNFCVKNIEFNNAKNCSVENCAILNKKTVGVPVQHNTCNSGCYFFKEDVTTNAGIQSKVLDEDDRFVDVDFIKIDTEGSEYYVILGAIEIIKKYKPLIQVEMNGLCEKNFGIPVKVLLELMNSLGYRQLEGTEFFYHNDFPFKKNNKIGVAIPSFCRDIPIIKRCLDSIEKQTFKPVIVAVSMSQVEKFPIQLPNYSFELKIICTPEFKNAAENRNIAGNYIISNYDVDIISFFDSDDEMVPTRLEFISRAFNEHDCDFVLHNFAETRNLYDKFNFSQTEYKAYYQKLEPHPFHHGVRTVPGINDIKNSDIAHGHISVSKKLWEKEKLNADKVYLFSEDSEYARRLVNLNYKSCYISSQLAKYHWYRLNSEEMKEVSEMQDKKLERRIFAFWTGNNPLTENRKRSIDEMENISKMPVIFVTPDNLNEWILKDHPIHPAYEYLSYVHRADYLRCYFMHHYGGGYTDVKKQTGSWVEAFDMLDENKLCYGNGYTEVPGGVAGVADKILYETMNSNYNKLIGNGAYIFKPYTKFTEEWYKQLNDILDKKLELLKIHPAKHPRDQTGMWLSNEHSKYPITWSEILGSIFHPLAYKYSNRLLQTVPAPLFNNYL